MKQFRKRYGNISVPRSQRAALDTAISETHGPGSIFEIDATIANVYVLSSYFDYDDPVNPHEPVIIGRPVIYHIVDVFSRMIVAIYVGVIGPSWEAAGLAVRNLLEDKVHFCKQYGINLSDFDDEKLGFKGTELFPQLTGIPELLRADHGEFRGDLPEPLVQTMGISIENHQVYCPDLKGTTEQSFRLTQLKGEFTQLFTVEQSFKRRDEILGRGINPQKIACLTLKEFISLYIRIVLRLNGSVRDDYPKSKNMIPKNIPAIPVKLWQYGIANLSGQLRKPPVQQIDKALMLRKSVSTCRHGIQFLKDQYYTCQYAEQHGWFEKGNYQKKVQLAYHPYDTSQLWLVINHKGQEDYIPCQLTPRCKAKYENVSFSDGEFIKRYEEDQNFEISFYQNQKDTTHSHIDAVLEQAQKRIPKDGHRPSQLKNMKPRKEEDKERERQARHDDRSRASTEDQDQSEEPQYVNPMGAIPEETRPSTSSHVTSQTTQPHTSAALERQEKMRAARRQAARNQKNRRD